MAKIASRWWQILPEHIQNRDFLQRLLIIILLGQRPQEEEDDDEEEDLNIYGFSAVMPHVLLVWHSGSL